MSGRSRFLSCCSLLLWKTASKHQKKKIPDQLSKKKKKKRTIAVREGGQNFRFHTTNIQYIFFWRFILLLCYFLSLFQDWNKTLIGWKWCLTFSFSLNFWVCGGGKAQRPPVCTWESILVSDKSLVYDSVPSLSLGSLWCSSPGNGWLSWLF